MGDKVLVAYASWTGFTREVAQVIGQVLAGEGTEDEDAGVDVRPARKVIDVSPYRAVVLGTGIRLGQVHADATVFLEAHQKALGQVPVAFFIVCLTMREDTEESRAAADAYLDALRDKVPRIQPVDVAFFAGALDPRRLSWPLRLFTKWTKKPEGDFRDWAIIQDWAACLRPTLLEG